MFHSKKGELSDMLIFLITVFVLAIGFFIVIFIIPSVTSSLRFGGLNNSVEGAAAIDSLDGLTGIVNYGFLLLFTGLIISLMISSFLVRTHPIFLFLYIIFLGVTIFLGFYLGNAYDTLITNPIFATTLANASFLNAIMSHIAEISLAVGALSMVILFAKFSSFGDTGGTTI